MGSGESSTRKVSFGVDEEDRLGHAPIHGGGALAALRQLLIGPIQQLLELCRTPPEELELLAKKLQKKDADLKAMDAFYKEQLALLEKRSKRIFIAHKARGTEAVCSGLQAQILSCYRENRQETLRCSDLAKEYRQCISTAKKQQQQQQQQQHTSLGASVVVFKRPASAPFRGLLRQAGASMKIKLAWEANLMVNHG
ncbi:hypothetical protein CRUP_010804 [Coryphaenoides rupestris]|nr:hypothetical protein CRUP_010804 [Coryphaenoides rupestris]